MKKIIKHSQKLQDLLKKRWRDGQYTSVETFRAIKTSLFPRVIYMLNAISGNINRFFFS